MDGLLFPGNDEEDNTDEDIEPKIPPSTFEDDCPRPSDAICTKIYLPVICDGFCFYSNECVAASAGYDVDQSCIPDDGPE